jgi:hypothetical protein
VATKLGLKSSGVLAGRINNYGKEEAQGEDTDEKDTASLPMQTRRLSDG